MAITTPLKGTGGISDATINTMLQSGDPDLIKEANKYVAAREKEIKERGADKGILGIVADLLDLVNWQQLNQTKVYVVFKQIYLLTNLV